MSRIPTTALDQVMRRALARRGLSPEHAAWVAEGLLETSLRGVDTHGVRLFPTYLAELDGGRAAARPEVRTVSGTGAALALDAGGALGMVAGMLACREVVRLAHAHGVGAVSVRNSNHFGAAARYTLELARHGLVGLAFSNSDALVAPFGGVRPFFGTNPLALAARGEGEDLLSIDMATSQVSYSKVRERRRDGLPLDPGWAVAADGADAAGTAAEVAALAPLGGHKGECLGILVEVLCAILGGAPFDGALSHLFAEPFDRPRQVAHFFLGLEVGAFVEPARFRERLSQLLARLRGEPAIPGEAVLAPGDPETAAARDRQANGIPVDDADLAALRRIDAEAPEERVGL